MAEKRKRKFVPTVRVPSDDLTITDEAGDEYAPHAGEWVKFRRGISIASMRVVASAGEIGEDADPAETIEILSDVLGILARQIVDWSWTDDDWNELPKPRDREAFASCLENLETYEINWLVSHLADGAKVPNP
jgi:hypothetical protein